MANSPEMSYKLKRDWLTNQQRRDRNGVIIEMRLTYEQWAQIWQDSGHFGEWGNTRGKYVMSRIDDLGHYEVGNVFIQPHGKNTADANKRRVGKLNPRFGITPPPTDPKYDEWFSANGHRSTQLEHTCIHCNKTGQGPGMYRWHFDNCKHKEKS